MGRPYGLGLAGGRDMGGTGGIDERATLVSPYGLGLTRGRVSPLRGTGHGSPLRVGIDGRAGRPWGIGTET